MKNFLKVIGALAAVLILGYFTDIFLQNFLGKYLSTASYFIVGDLLSVVTSFIYLSLLWLFLFQDKDMVGTFFQRIKLKKTFIVIMVAFVLIAVADASYNIQDYKKTLSVTDTSHFLANSVYENSQYNFKLTYPEGSVFAHATAGQGTGMVTRFFLPGGQTVGGDQENVGIQVLENSSDLETLVTNRKNAFSKNGPLDIKEVTFGGQKGYRMIFVSDYSVNKGTKELSYITVKNGTSFELNYFPVVDQNIPTFDKIAQSFGFTQ